MAAAGPAGVVDLNIVAAFGDGGFHKLVLIAYQQGPPARLCFEGAVPENELIVVPARYILKPKTDGSGHREVKVIVVFFV